MVSNPRQRLERVLEENRDLILAQINSLLGAELRRQIVPEEILHEVILAALKKPEPWKDRKERELLFYLQWKAKMMVIDKWRRLDASTRARHRLENRISKDTFEAGRVVPSPTTILHRQAKSKEVRNYLTKLDNPELREALRLVHLQGLSFSEAAIRMNKEVAELRKLLRDGLRILMKTAESMGAEKFETSGDTT